MEIWMPQNYPYFYFDLFGDNRNLRFSVRTISVVRTFLFLGGETSMEEKILIKSKPCNINPFVIVTIIMGEVLSIIFYYSIENWYLPENERILWSLIPIAAFSLIAGLVYLWLHSYELTVTDKRIFGVVGWGKRVDLPVDSVSATAKLQFWRGVSVSTSSGRISFLLMKNADDIYNVLNKLMIERQQGKNNTSSNNTTPPDVTEQLKKYKELLDSGVITQDEFDAKKKELLGL